MAWLTKQEYASKLGCSTKTVERRASDGTLANYCRSDGKRMFWLQPGGETSTQTRLDRIEEKLDELLRRGVPGARAAPAAPARKKKAPAAAQPTPTTRTTRVKRKVAAKAAELAEDPGKAPDYDSIVERVNNFWIKKRGRSIRDLAKTAPLPRNWISKAMKGEYRSREWLSRWYKLDLTLKAFEKLDPRT